MRTVLLLTLSNVFMTFAWYGHLKHKGRPLLLVILVSWMIALPEYCFQVPANRIGHRTFSAAQLKVMQEVITLAVFCVFSLLYLREPIRWNYILGFLLIVAAVGVVFGLEPGKTTGPTLPGAAEPGEGDQGLAWRETGGPGLE
jgi:uncharacterized protein (DUF486 family)